MDAESILLERLDQRIAEAKIAEKFWASKLVAAATADDDEALHRVSDSWLKANADLNKANEQRQTYVDNRTVGRSVRDKF